MIVRGHQPQPRLIRRGLCRRSRCAQQIRQLRASLFVHQRHTARVTQVSDQFTLQFDQIAGRGPVAAAGKIFPPLKICQRRMIFTPDHSFFPSFTAPHDDANHSHLLSSLPNKVNSASIFVKICTRLIRNKAEFRRLISNFLDKSPDFFSCRLNSQENFTTACSYGIFCARFARRQQADTGQPLVTRTFVAKMPQHDGCAICRFANCMRGNPQSGPCVKNSISGRYRTLIRRLIFNECDRFEHLPPRGRPAAFGRHGADACPARDSPDRAAAQRSARR